MKMIEICQFGAGRIGRIHADNITTHSNARVRYMVDVNPQSAEDLAARCGAAVVDKIEALADPAIDAVVIASSTDTHAALVEDAARAGKAIFCEKPIDLELERVNACLDVVEAAGVPMLVGFNRRYDPSFAALCDAIRAGRIGKLEMLTITSRDPTPPSLDYLRVSGGLFRDMMIHDFDMARWLLDDEPVELFGTASCLIDPQIAEEGDVDTAVVVMRTEGGTICQISNSRRAVYGYDQRVEAFGSGGMIQAGNRFPTATETWGGGGIVRDKPFNFFLERYAEAYKAELDHFISCVEGEDTPQVNGRDGQKAMVLSEAAEQSQKTGRPVRV